MQRGHRTQDSAHAIRLALILGLFSTLPITSFGQEPDWALAPVISEGYQKNRDLLRTLRSKFTYATGTAKSYDRAFDEDFATDRTLLCNWLTKGPFEKWESFASVDKAATRFAEQQEIVYLRDGKTTLVYHPRDRSANLRPPDVPAWTDLYTPLNLMIMADNDGFAPSTCLQKSLAGEFVLKELSQKLIDSKPCYFLAFLDSKEVHANLINMVIDPALGFLPVKLTINNPRSDIECRILETKQLPNGAWFPMSARLVLRQKSEHPNAKTFVSSIKVLEDHTEPEPTDEDFSMDLSKGSVILNLAKGTAFFRLGDERRVLADELNSIGDYTLRIANNQILHAKTDKPSELDAMAAGVNSSYRTVIATSLILATIVVLCVLAKFVNGLRSKLDCVSSRKLPN